MNVTIYKTPNGRTEVIDLRNINDDDAKWFEQNNVAVSMEEIGGQFAVYGDVGRMHEGEPDEVLVLSQGRDCFETMAQLRIECQEAIAEMKGAEA